MASADDVLARPAVRRVAFFTAYVVTGLLGRRTIIDEGSLSLVWPAAGVAVLWLLASRTWRERWLDLALLAAATGVVNGLTGASVGLTAVFVVTNVVQAVVATWLLRRGAATLWGAGGGGTLTTAARFSALVSAAFAAAVVGAAIGAGGTWLVADMASWPRTLLWWGRNFTGILAVVALGHLLLHRWWFGTDQTRRDDAPSPRRVLEGVALAALSTVGYLTVFLSDDMPVVFPLLALSVWVGLRFGPLAAAGHSVACGAAAVALTLEGGGPFVVADQLEVRPALTQLFVVAVVVVALALATTRHEREAALEQLEAAEELATARARLWQAVAESTADGIVVVAEDGRIVHTNGPARDMMRRSLSGVVGRVQDFEVLWPDGRPARLKPGSGAHDLRVVGADHSTLMISASVTALDDISPYGLGPGAVIVYHDVTKEREHRAQLAGFASVVAHDLRNPLTAVISWIGIARRLAAADELDVHRLDQALDRAYAAAVRMNDLIGDLLTQARSEGQELCPETLDVAALVEEVAALHGLSGEVVASKVPAVVADPTLFQQLLHNLVGNAVKYVEPGVTPRVLVSGHVDGGHTVLDISDNGIGIPPDQREAVFERFHRAHGDRSEYSGTGLGLSICRTIMARHDGRIEVLEGPDGTGSTFRLRFPRPTAASG